MIGDIVECQVVILLKSVDRSSLPLHLLQTMTFFLAHLKAEEIVFFKLGSVCKLFVLVLRGSSNGFHFNRSVVKLLPKCHDNLTLGCLLSFSFMRSPFLGLLLVFEVHGRNLWGSVNPLFVSCISISLFSIFFISLLSRPCCLSGCKQSLGVRLESKRVLLLRRGRLRVSVDLEQLVHLVFQLSVHRSHLLHEDPQLDELLDDRMVHDRHPVELQEQVEGQVRAVAEQQLQLQLQVRDSVASRQRPFLDPLSVCRQLRPYFCYLALKVSEHGDQVRRFSCQHLLPQLLGDVGKGVNSLICLFHMLFVVIDNLLRRLLLLR
mmetsp:Transcript_42494/g.133849  ORF Transcript_42494/g.133849 Transcript_42494/m.133849 type:complete len:320 (-) Transcript_42494:144-1103(-)